MANYEYKCVTCKTVTEKMRSISDREKPIICECGQVATFNPSFNTTPPRFNGSGFHATDYNTKEGRGRT